MDRCNIFNADCKSGIVYVNGKVVDGVEIASQGQAASKGFMFLNGEKKVYFAVPIESLKEILDLLRELSVIVSSGVLPTNKAKGRPLIISISGKKTPPRRSTTMAGRERLLTV